MLQSGGNTNQKGDAAKVNIKEHEMRVYGREIIIKPKDYWLGISGVCNLGDEDSNVV